MDALHVLDQGSGPAIAWIHGFPLSSRTFARQLEIPGVRHLAPDLPGFGRSGQGAIESIDDYAVIVREAMESASSPGTCQALRAMAARADSAPVLRAFQNPVLVVVGSRDELTPPSDASRMASMAKGSALVEIPEAAHLSNVEQPEAFNDAVTRFLTRIR